MPSSDIRDQKLADRANELYWRSGRSVNQLAEEMDLSKSRLYGLVRPLPAGGPCPECQTELVFPNRTAMEKGFVRCPDCSFDSPADGPPTTAEPSSKPSLARSRAGGAAKTAPKSRGSATVQADTAAPPASATILSRQRAKRVLWGSALLGAAVGIYVVMRQRRS